MLWAEARVESNVLYGMYSGLALLLDVHYPADPNGYGIVFIATNRFHTPLNPDAEPTKQRAEHPPEFYLGPTVEWFDQHLRNRP